MDPLSPTLSENFRSQGHCNVTWDRASKRLMTCVCFLKAQIFNGQSWAPTSMHNKCLAIDTMRLLPPNLTVLVTVGKLRCITNRMHTRQPMISFLVPPLGITTELIRTVTGYSGSLRASAECCHLFITLIRHWRLPHTRLPSALTLSPSKGFSFHL